MSLERKAQASIIRGEDKAITIRLEDEQDEIPYNLSNASDYKVLFVGTGGTAIVKTRQSGDVTLINNGNALQVILRAADTLLLALGDNQYVEVRVTDNGRTNYAQIENALTVRDSLFPNT